jgi:5-formyltetrahydrofolate cyclo-ligase
MKNKLRQELTQKRKNLSKNEVLEKSDKIKKRLFETDEFKQASNIVFYVSYDNEVYTHEMIKECITNKKNVVVPMCDKEERCLILSKLDSWDDLETGSYGILEPRKDKVKEFLIDKVDLIIVPGLGFDKSGHRIGHGKGYYDGLLKNSRNALHIGLAFESQIIKKIPIEVHDLPVHIIVTEKRVVDCRKSK